jgi:GNAT superfamily N-acetyltransferase
MSFAYPALISVEHDVAPFDCGNLSLNEYLQRFALSNSASGIARTWVTTASGGGPVVGYYSLVASSVEKARVPDRVAKGTPNLPVPVVLLARLAVDSQFQNRGLGRSLLRDALSRTLLAAEVIGVRAVLVHAKNDDAARFYRSAGFTPSPTDPLHLMLLVKDARKSLAAPI